MNNNRILLVDKGLLEAVAKGLPDLKGLANNLDSSKVGVVLEIFLKSLKRCLEAMENKEDKFKLKVKILF
jgi:hypothetical protein